MKQRIVMAMMVLASGAGQSLGAEPAPFSKGTAYFAAEADYAHSFDLSRARIESGSIGVGYYFLDNFSFGADAMGLDINQSDQDSDLAEFDLKVRNHMVCLGKLSLFSDFAAGVSYANHRTPSAGTQFNFVLQPGLGATWQLTSQAFLTAGCRYWHLSNAHLEGPNRNPSINSIEGYVGVMFLF